MKQFGTVELLARSFELFVEFVYVSVLIDCSENSIERMLSVPVHIMDSNSVRAGEVQYQVTKLYEISRIRATAMHIHPLILVPDMEITRKDCKNQVVHELGHLLTITRYGLIGHGNHWRNIVRSLGGTAETYHRLKLGTETE